MSRFAENLPETYNCPGKNQPADLKAETDCLTLLNLLFV